VHIQLRHYLTLVYSFPLFIATADVTKSIQNSRLFPGDLKRVGALKEERKMEGGKKGGQKARCPVMDITAHCDDEHKLFSLMLLHYCSGPAQSVKKVVTNFAPHQVQGREISD